MPNDGAPSPAGDSPADSRSHRAKVWLLADRPNGAYDDLCQGIAAAVSCEFEARIAYATERPDLGAWKFDLVLVCSWAETWHRRLRTRVGLRGGHR